MDLVFCRFVLLKDEHTQGYLMFADYASVQGIFAAAEVATVREIHTIFVAVAVLDQGADFAVRPVSYGDGKGTVSQASNSRLVTLRG
jgi:hypothetical protein